MPRIARQYPPVHILLLSLLSTRWTSHTVPPIVVTKDPLEWTGDREAHTSRVLPRFVGGFYFFYSRQGRLFLVTDGCVSCARGETGMRLARSAWLARVASKGAGAAVRRPPVSQNRNMSCVPPRFLFGYQVRLPSGFVMSIAACS